MVVTYVNVILKSGNNEMNIWHINITVNTSTNFQQLISMHSHSHCLMMDPWLLSILHSHVTQVGQSISLYSKMLITGIHVLWRRWMQGEEWPGDVCSQHLPSLRLWPPTDGYWYSAYEGNTVIPCYSYNSSHLSFNYFWSQWTFPRSIQSKRVCACITNRAHRKTTGSAYCFKKLVSWVFYYTLMITKGD